MDQPDFERARQYAINRLEKDLPSGMCYHSLFHTVNEVLPAVERLAAYEHVEGEDLILLRTAAIYHDLGFVLKYRDHETASALIASETLPRFGYNPQQIERICAMIKATKLPQSPDDLLEQILADADLDVLGREDFLPRNQDLREELAGVGQPTSDENWYGGQLRFVQNHRYFTAAAKHYRDAIKQRNIQAMIQLVDSAE